MHKFNKGKSTHSQRLEKWLGSDVVASLSDTFKNFYYPIRVNGVPGEVYIMPGGDFAGSIAVGMYACEFWINQIPVK